MYSEMSGDKPRSSSLPWYQRKSTYALAGLALLVVLFVANLFSVNGTGTQWDTQLRAQYNDCWQTLSQYYVNGENSLKIADTNATKLKEILTAVAAGRYGSSGEPERSDQCGLYTACHSLPGSSQRQRCL